MLNQAAQKYIFILHAWKNTMGLGARTPCALLWIRPV